MHKKTKIKIATTIIALAVLWAMGEINISFTGLAREMGSFSGDEVASSTLEATIGKEGPYGVVKVVDGDTLNIVIDGKTERIRLIGINTPETVDPRKEVECFGKEASDMAKSILSGRSVYIEGDDSQDNRDKYGRLLRYVFLSDGANFNKLMIEKGFAYEYTYQEPYLYQKDFREAQNKAENEKMGLWAEDVCPG